MPAVSDNAAQGSANPLLDPQEQPAFAAVRAEHVEPAIDELLREGRDGIAALLADAEAPPWETLVEPLALIDTRLERAWSTIAHLNAVMNSEELRAAYTKCLVKLSTYYTERGQSEDLCAAYARVADCGGLNAEQRRVLDNALRDFRLAGVELPAKHKARFRDISEELSKLTSDFSDRVLDATHAWTRHVTDAAQLAGLPPSALDLFRHYAEARGLDGHVLTLDQPCYLPVLTYADDAALREDLYRAYSTRASDEGPNAGQFDNGDNMARILALRHEAARLLGFANYAERSLATKMARSTDEVMAFLHDLTQRAHACAKEELASLQRFAAEHYGQAPLNAWDIPYYSEKQRQHLHAISEEELKPYFPADRVLTGLFEVATRLFGIGFRAVELTAGYHPDLRCYELRDANGEKRALCYLDLYARQNKRGGAWMAVSQSRMVAGGETQLPVAFLTCNFTPPVGGRAPLLTHREVETLFHEFGHGLHHMLTRIDYPAIAGISGVAWDAVELPSQFMENYCWEREALDLFAAHHETGEPLPEDLFARMVAARNFQAGMKMVRQLEFAIFEFRMHLEYDPAVGERIYEILEDVRRQVAVVPTPSWNRFAHAFTHVFGGGYAAGYYSYLWAEVLSADAFSLFRERGVFDRATGTAFRERILERGGAEDAMALFVAFRGREPRIDALLQHHGIAA